MTEKTERKPLHPLTRHLLLGKLHGMCRLREIAGMMAMDGAREYFTDEELAVIAGAIGAEHTRLIEDIKSQIGEKSDG